MHQLRKRLRHTLDTDSSSDDSIYRSTTHTWESITRDLSLIVSEAVPGGDEGSKKETISGRSSDGECFILATELQSWLRKVRHRISCRREPHISIYQLSLDLCELQQYDRKRRKLLSLAAKVLPEVSRAESSRLSKRTTPTTSIKGTEATASSKTRLTTAETLTTTQPTALRVPPVDQKNASTHDSMKLIDEWDTNPTSVHLAVLVEHLSNEWDELLRSVQPIDPLEDKDEFLKSKKRKFTNNDDHPLAV